MILGRPGAAAGRAAVSADVLDVLADQDGDQEAPGKAGREPHERHPQCVFIQK